MPYNFEKKTCDKCGITKEEHNKKYPWNSIAEYRHEFSSFRLNQNGGVLCGLCASERQLEDLFAVMDAKEKKSLKKKGHSV